MRKLLRKIWNDDRGNVLIIMGAALPMLVGAAGLATDTIQWTLWKRQLQRAADSAAIAGVYTRLRTDTEEAVEAAVDADLAINHHTGIELADDYPDVERMSDDGTKRKRVQVTLVISKSLPFSAMFMSNPPQIRATATAASVPGADEFCVFATDTSVTSVGIEITGSTYVDLGTCSLMANSTNPTQAASNGNSGGANNGQNSTVIARSLAAAGGVKYSNNWTVSDYDPNSPPLTDPFASLTVPSCTKTVTADMTKNQTYPMDRTVTGTDHDAAGDVVCFSGPANKKGVTVNGTLKLQDGVTYVIDGGDLNMSSAGSSLSCNNCTIILTNSANPAQTGNIKITGGTLAITAPTSGTYQGVAFYQDRRATDDKTAQVQNQITGNNGTSVTGAIYTANRSLTYTGGSSSVSACAQIVAKRVKFTGNSKFALTSTCPLSGLTPIGGGQRVRLVG